ncbi:MAG: penicillin-binding transpeptidase domain-containing protein, partial [Lysinibacillus sp.]
AEQIASVLKVEADKLYEKLAQPAYLTKIAPEGKNITKEQADTLQRLAIPGLFIVTDYKRHYPYDTLLARLLGFTGYDNQGLAGIEFQYEEALSSTQAALRLYTDAKGKALPSLATEFRPGNQGATVQLTIDVAVQQIVENKLALAMQQYEAAQALAIVANPSTGEILALSSYPTYFPGNYKKVPSDIYNQNLPVFMTYEPGSTFKIITLAAALEENLIDLHNEHFYDKGYTMVEDARLRCWKREGHKDQTFLQVVENSCNPGFVEMGRRLGNERLLSYIRAFGFGQRTGANIAGEATGILFHEDNFGPVEAATTAFGQGVSVTPIQQIQAVSAAINGGKLFQPYIVQALLNPETNKPIKTFQPTLKRNVISEATSNDIRLALESVVANGSGRQAFRDGLRVGGKTGTAQKVVNGAYKDGEYIVSFIGFAPANDPQLIVYVAVDQPVAHLQFGSVIAAPIVGEIIEEISMTTDYLKAQKGQLEKKFVWGDPVTVRVPNYVGQTKDDIL